MLVNFKYSDIDNFDHIGNFYIVLYYESGDTSVYRYYYSRYDISEQFIGNCLIDATIKDAEKRQLHTGSILLIAYNLLIKYNLNFNLYEYPIASEEENNYIKQLQKTILFI